MNVDSLTKDALYYDYSSAVNPLIQGLITKVPCVPFSPDFFNSPTTAVLPLDVSQQLELEGPATSPSLCANFVRIVNGSLQTSVEAASQLFFVHDGEGRTDACGLTIEWKKGDLFVLPAHAAATHHAKSGSLYWVHDAPLLRYLGAKPTTPRFAPTLYTREKDQAKLDQIASDPVTASANRVSVLMANANFPQTRTVSPTIWAMYGLLPLGKSQLPHRHESVALDFVVDCKPGCYTNIGTELGEDGWIKNPQRQDWAPGAVFITPPGYWHSHHNESGADAHVLPIQDAGLQEYLRTLEINFSHIQADGSVHVTNVP